MSDDNAHEYDALTYTSAIESPVDYVPRRVVSLVPSLTEALFDLDLGDRLVGITENCVHPADKVQLVPRVGGTQQPDIDQIISLRPDLVLLNADDNRADAIDALQAANLPVWITGPRTVFAALNVLWSIMDIFDHPVMVPRVREIERAYDYTGGAARAQTPVPVIALLRSDQPGSWITCNADTFTHDLLRVCGGKNVLAEAEDRYPRISLSEITAAQPTAMLIGSELASDREQLLALDMPAAHQERIHLVDVTLLTWHGMRIGFALRDLPTFIMEEESEDDD
ncbi:MAG: ABC transporter substrate-binding protein [Anaerolineae bacterium]|nr:ABC transporter substrate-binding protein [Anaerolineae bacterium]